MVPTCSIARWAFWTFGRPTSIWSCADPRDLGLGDAERVDALADDLDRAVDVLGVDVGVCGVGRRLVDELGPALRGRARASVFLVVTTQIERRRAARARGARMKRLRLRTLARQSRGGART